MAKAIDKVINEGTSITSTALAYLVPKTTLIRRLALYKEYSNMEIAIAV